MSNAAVLVPRPIKERTLNALDMRGDEREIPDPVEVWARIPKPKDVVTPDGWWLCESGDLRAQAYVINSYSELTDPRPVTVKAATVALCVVSGRLLGIASPNDESADAVWFAFNANDVSVTIHSNSTATLLGKDWTLEVTGVSELNRHWMAGSLKKKPYMKENYQTSKAHTLASALSKAVGAFPREPTARTGDAPLSDHITYEWRLSPELGRVRRLVRNDELTTVTWPVDRELPIAEQIANLLALEWYPIPMRDAAIKWTEEGTLGLTMVALPEGRVRPPWSSIETSHTTLGGDMAHPVARYFWPTINTGGQLVLEEGEEVVGRWAVPGAGTLLVKINDPTTMWGAPTRRKAISKVEAIATNRRIAVISALAEEQGAASRGWLVEHMRYELVSAIGVYTNSPVKRTVVRAKRIPQPENAKWWVFVRMGTVAPGAKDLRLECASAAQAEALANAFIDAARQGGATPGQLEQINEELMFADVRLLTTPFKGAVPYSMPDSLETFA